MTETALNATVLDKSKTSRGAGRPDSVSPARGIWTFTSEFFRTRHYDFVDRRDMRPALAEVWDTAGIIRKQWANRKQNPE